MVTSTTLYKLLLLCDLQVKRVIKLDVGFDKINALVLYDMFFCRTTTLPDSDSMVQMGSPSPSMVVHVNVTVKFSPLLLN